VFCRLTHVTRYEYGRSVFLEPHLIRLVPRGDAAQRLLSLDIAVDPLPAGRAPVADAAGNAVLSAWFSGETGHLAVTVRAVVETLRDNPFDYLIEAGNARLPVPLAPAEATLLAPYLAAKGGSWAATDAAARQAGRDGGATPQEFSMALLAWIYDRVKTVVRHEPGILSPDEVLARGEGACRDLAAFFMAACRLVGIPARFVSGYHEGDPELGACDLHAWAEIFLPGGGWRGFDPSLGLAVADRHIAVAAAADPRDAAPIVGAFRGDGATPRLSHDIRLELSDRPGQPFF